MASAAKSAGEIAPGGGLYLQELKSGIHRLTVVYYSREDKIKPEASIIIPVRGLLGATRRCLDSVRLHTNIPHEIIVIDNASGPVARNYLKSRARSRGLRLVRNAENRSFAASINQGMRLARGEIIIWLNNDAVVTPDWLTRFKTILDADGEVGAVGACTNDPRSGMGRGARHWPPAKDLPGFAAAWSLRFQGQTEEAAWLSGFCLALRREVCAAVGALDERFIWGVEDIDYGFRLRLAGYKLILARDIFIWHAGSATRGRWSQARRKKLDDLNRELFRRKWVGTAGDIQRDAQALVEVL